MGGAHLMLIAEHGANRLIWLEVIRFLLNFQNTSAAISDFRKFTFGAQQYLACDEWKEARFKIW